MHTRGRVLVCVVAVLVGMAEDCYWGVSRYAVEYVGRQAGKEGSMHHDKFWELPILVPLMALSTLTLHQCLSVPINKIISLP